MVSKGAASQAMSMSRVCGPAVRLSTMRKIFGGGHRSPHRKKLVHQIVASLRAAVHARQPVHLGAQLELHFFGQHHEASQVGSFGSSGLARANFSFRSTSEVAEERRERIEIARGGQRRDGAGRAGSVAQLRELVGFFGLVVGARIFMSPT